MTVAPVTEFEPVVAITTLSPVAGTFPPIQVEPVPQAPPVAVLVIGVKYPFDWTYKTDKYEGVFKSKIQGENKVTLMRKVPGGQSEVCFIIRTPNTAKLPTAKVIEMAAQMNRAIDIKSISGTEHEIGGKSFKTSQNQFMSLMDQYHFWFADDKEIIYINYNLLKDERIRYPEVMKAIVESLSW